MKTQNELILEDLKAGHKITPLDALGRYGCFRLGARIYDLKKMGWPIRMKMIKTTVGKMIAQYSLDGKLEQGELVLK